MDYHGASLQIANTLHALTTLQKRHADFLDHLSEYCRTPLKGNQISVADGQITALLAGITCTGRARPVATNGTPSAMEYQFLVPFEGKDEPVGQFYLGTEGILFADSAKTQSLCECFSGDIAFILVHHLLAGLMQSRVFAPKA